MSGLPLPIAAFLAGLVSFLSPCVLPLVPGYVSLISGAGAEQIKSQDPRLLRKIMLNSISFILGFSVVFISLGAISTEVGQVLARYKSTLAQVAGVVIIIFGLHLTGIFRINALYADKRLHNVKGGSTRGRRIPDRLCLRFRLDALRGADSRRHPRFRRCPGFRAQGHRTADHLFAGIGRAVSAHLARPRTLPEILQPVPFPHACGWKSPAAPC